MASGNITKIGDIYYQNGRALTPWEAVNAIAGTEIYAPGSTTPNLSGNKSTSNPVQTTASTNTNVSTSAVTTPARAQVSGLKYTPVAAQVSAAAAAAAATSSFKNPNILDKGTLSSMVRNKFSAIGITGGDLDSLVNQAIGNSDLEYGTIFALLEGTSAYKNRFAGNKLLEEKGLAPLAEADYLRAERSYGEALANYEEILPPSMKIRDKNGELRAPKDFIASWIGGQVSVDEIEKRLLAAKDYSKSADPNLKKALKEYYGIGEDQIAQYALSTEQDLDTFIKQYSAVKIGSEALGQGLDVSRNLSEQLVSKDISTEQARAGFGNVAAQKESYGVLSGIEGANLTQEEMIKSQLDIDATAAAKTQTLRSKEESRFSGTGAGTNILGGTVSGSL